MQGNDKLFALVFVTILLLGSASAYTDFLIHLDREGNALFLGESNESINNLPEGVNLTNGKFQGSTDKLTSKQGEVWKFIYNYPNSDIQVFLPEGAVIKSTSAEISYSQSLTVYSKNSILVTYTLEDPTTNNYSIYLWILLVLLVCIVIFYIIKSRNRVKEPKINKKEIALKQKTKLLNQFLNDKEKIIIEKIKEYGKIKSSQLRKVCEIPKSSFARHIQELEKKKIIRRSGDGRNKFIELN